MFHPPAWTLPSKTPFSQHHTKIKVRFLDSLALTSLLKPADRFTVIFWLEDRDVKILYGLHKK